MATLIKMPKMGATMTEGTLTNWIVKEGDTVEEGDAIFEVETDKLSNEIESYEDGTILRILVEERFYCSMSDSGGCNRRRRRRLF